MQQPQVRRGPPQRWLALVVVLLVGACGTPAANTTSLTSSSAASQGAIGLPGYIARSSNGIVFLQWTRSGDSVSGSITEAYLTIPGLSTSLQHQNATFGGVVSGSSVTLTFPQSFGVGTSWNGTLQGDQLVISYPAADGSLTTLTFTPGTIDDYNTAVADLQSQARGVQELDQAAPPKWSLVEHRPA